MCFLEVLYLSHHFSQFNLHAFLASTHPLRTYSFHLCGRLPPTPSHTVPFVREAKSEFQLLCGLWLQPPFCALSPLSSGICLLTRFSPIPSPSVLRERLGVSPVYLWWPHGMVFWDMPVLWSLIAWVGIWAQFLTCSFGYVTKCL